MIDCALPLKSPVHCGNSPCAKTAFLRTEYIFCKLVRKNGFPAHRMRFFPSPCADRTYLRTVARINGPPVFALRQFFIS